jgi:Reverse transcriptase (RNA-dependent DNA polymerase)
MLSNIAASSAHRKTAGSHTTADGEMHASALLSEFAPFYDTHMLVPLSTDVPFPSIDDALHAIASGSTDPVLIDNDDPSWSEALASPEWEFWIAGGCEELRLLADLNVFMLIPCSALPHG